MVVVVGLVNHGDHEGQAVVVEIGGRPVVLVKKSGRSGTSVVVVLTKGGRVTGVVLGPKVVPLEGPSGPCVVVVAPSHMTCFTTME